MLDPTDWAGTLGPVGSHRTQDGHWMWRSVHLHAQSSCRLLPAELSGFQERVKRGLALAGRLAWPLTSQEEHHHPLLFPELESTAGQAQRRTTAPWSRGEGAAGQAGCGAGGGGLWSEMGPCAPLSAADDRPGRGSLTSAVFPRGRLLGCCSDAPSDLPATWLGFPPLQLPVRGPLWAAEHGDVSALPRVGSQAGGDCSCCLRLTREMFCQRDAGIE